MPPSGALRDHNILISLSVFWANRGSSFWEPFAYNSSYDCTLLLVPFSIMICSNFHLLSMYQRGGDISLLWLTACGVQLCFKHAFVVEVSSFCILLIVLPKAPLIRTPVSSEVWEGPRCRLSQGWQLGAVLTCSLIKSSWARVHLWQGLCQAADRWEAVLITNVTSTGDRQEMHCAPCCANNRCVSVFNIWYDTRKGSRGRMYDLPYFLSTGCVWMPPVVCIRENIPRCGSLCEEWGWGGADLFRARVLPLFICIGADLPTGAQREAEGPFLKWVTG